MINFYQILNQSGVNNNPAKYTQMNRRIEKASQMTRNGYSLWGELTSDTAIGVIQSQTDQKKFYYSFIRADGTFGCFDNMLAPCLGQPLYLSNHQRKPPRNRNHNRRNYLDFEDEEDNFLPGGDYEYKPRWEYAQPCKHIFSLINGFCIHADSSIQDLLEKWILLSLSGSKHPVRDAAYGQYIQSRFDPIRHQVLERIVFAPLIQTRNERYELYKPSKNVKILDLDGPKREDPVFELHCEISNNEVTPLPLKNCICISCLIREQMQSKLERWVKCTHCLSYICGSCYATLKEETNTITCPSVFSGYKQHKLEVIGFNETTTKKVVIVNTNPSNTPIKNVLFRFGDN